MKLHIILASVLLFVFSVPGITQAYSVTNTSAKDLGNGYALFTVTYKFGFLNREMYMPIVASRNTKYTDTGSNVGYSILINNETGAKASTSLMQNGEMSASLNYSILPGKSKAIILSEAEIKDNHYYLPEGKSETFTLIALVDMNNVVTKNDISLQMTSLPYIMVDDKEQFQTRLTESELTAYKSPTVSLK